MRRWLWVTQPEFWSQLQGGQLDRGLSVEWTCANDTLPGDVALLYRADMAKDIAYLFRVDGEQPWLNDHPLRPNHDAYWCEAKLVHPLRQPLLLSDLRRDPRLDRWAALEINFHALAFEIDGRVWDALLDLAHPLDRIALRRYGSN